MRRLGVLMILFTVQCIVSILGPNLGRSDDSQLFVNIIEEQVKTIVHQVQINYANREGLISTCDSNCSRIECYPRKNSKSNKFQSSCVVIFNNSLCQSGTSTACNHVQATFGEGYVRTPLLNFTFGGSVDQVLGNSICTQRELDPIFIRASTNIGAVSGPPDSFFELYFGAVDGSFRLFPGREMIANTCNKYDPRMRPWYTGTISVVKDVVVALDTSSRMQTFFTVAAGNSSTMSLLTVATTMTQQLMNTLTANDRLSIIPFNAVGPMFNDSLTASVGASAVAQNLSLQNEIQNMLTSISSGNNAEVSAAPSNFTAAFLSALSFFNSSPSSDQGLRLKIVVLITEGVGGLSTPSEQDRQTVLAFESENVRLFVYELMDPDKRRNESYTFWADLACEIGGYDEKLDTFAAVLNPLSTLASYFTFLARSRIATNQSLPFWQKDYVDATGLGHVMTVGYPAMSDDGFDQLLGVVGIDIQVGGLTGAFTNEVDSDVGNNILIPYCNNQTGAFISDCSGVYKPQSELNYGGNNSICTRPDDVYTGDSVPTYESLVCCGGRGCNCGDACRKDNIPLILVVSLGFGISGTIILLLLTIARIVRIRRFRPLIYSFKQIRSATNNFDEAYVIGRGGFGVVYRVLLGDGNVVAVKKLRRPPDFRAEIKTLGITRHDNLVELKGHFKGPTDRFLVYEFVEGGDLQGWLWPNEQNCARFLTWVQRINIARGTARGLTYLHDGIPGKRIFHLDIKPHNILLDLQSFNPKIADFGLSRLYVAGYTWEFATLQGGTPGYIAPDVLDALQAGTPVIPTTKMDVYSYGMVLLQLMTGRQTSDPMMRPGLLHSARENEEVGNAVRDLLDRHLVQRLMEDCRSPLVNTVRKMISFSLRCLSYNPNLRPEMSEVLEFIENELVETVQQSASTENGGHFFSARTSDSPSGEIRPRFHTPRETPPRSPPESPTSSLVGDH